MHELSIAESIVEIVVRHARGRRVTKVEMKVGHLRQVVPAALSFAFDLVAQGTMAEGAELVMEEIPATVHCAACGSDSVSDAFPLSCRCCGNLDVNVVRGEELSVDTLELHEAVLA